MAILLSIQNSLKNIRAHKLRSFLTMLGMIIGIAAVIIVISVGAGAQSLVINQIQSLGSNLIGVFPGASEENGPPASVLGITITTLTYDDALALNTTHQVPNVIAVAAYVQGVGSISYEENSLNTTFMGTTASYTQVEDVSVATGRFFDADEERSLSRVVVLGSAIAEDLFGQANPVGQNVKLKKESFKVIGVMQERGVVLFVNEDRKVFVPIKTAQKILLGIDHVNVVRAKVNSEENLDQAVADTKTSLRELHNIDNPSEDDFLVRSPQTAIAVFTQITNSLRFFLAAIASIALLVGGIGIMNIMLVAVNERIREIGLRQAVGAKRSDILKQFLVETTVISLIGGLIGIAIGVAVSALVAYIAKWLGYQWSFVVTPSSVILATVFSVAVGFVFGLYPAWKASTMDPIDALRYE